MLSQRRHAKEAPSCGNASSIAAALKFRASCRAWMRRPRRARLLAHGQHPCMAAEMWAACLEWLRAGARWALMSAGAGARRACWHPMAHGSIRGWCCRLTGRVFVPLVAWTRWAWGYRRGCHGASAGGQNDRRWGMPQEPSHRGVAARQPPPHAASRLAHQP